MSLPHDEARGNRKRRTRTGATAKRQRRRRLLTTASWSAVILLIALSAAAWLGVKASTIREELSSAIALLPTLKDKVLHDDVQSVNQTVAELKEHTAEARKAAVDPIWTMAGTLPWLGDNFRAASEVAASADDVAQLAAGPLANVFQSLDWKTLAPNAEGINLAPLAAAEPKLASAAHAVRESSSRLKSIDTGSLLPPVAHSLTEAKSELESLRGGLDTAADVARIAPNMMGAEERRRYLLLIQNSAEVRATGGVPGALAVLNVENGKLKLESQTSATAMGAFDPPLTTDPEQKTIYSVRLGKYMQDVNLTPDFPTAAKTAGAMWEKKQGERLDGVVSIDPVALGYILSAIGPVQISASELQEIPSQLPRELTAKNVVPTLLSDVYSKIPEPALQDTYFAGVAREIFSAVSTSKGGPKLLDMLGRSVSEGRISIWADSKLTQSVISKYPISGSISGPSISPAQFGVYFNDGTGAKMDLYVKRTVQLIQMCSGAGYSEVKVRVTSTNTAPLDAATSLPPYVTGAGAFGVPAGTVQTNIVAYGPVQSHVENAVADDKKVSFASQLHSGRPVGTVTVALPPGKSSTVDFTFGKIVQHTEPKLSVTPTVQPLKEVVLDTIREECVPAP